MNTPNEPWNTSDEIRNTSDEIRYATDKNSRRQASLEPAGDLKGQGSLDPQDSAGGKKKPVFAQLGKLLPVLLAVTLVAAVWLILQQSGTPAPEPAPSPAGSTAQSTPAAEDDSAGEDTGTDAAAETPAEEEAEASSETEAEAPAEAEAETPVEIVLPDTFGDQYSDFTDDRYITNLSHYSSGPSLIGARQEAVVIPWDALTSTGMMPAFLNHMSESLSVSFDSTDNFPYTDYTFSYSSDSAQEEAQRNIDYLTSSADSYTELVIGNVTDYTCGSGTYLMYEVLLDYSSGPSLQTYALRDLDGGGCFTVLLDQFYPSSGDSAASITSALVDDRYPEDFLTVLDALEVYTPDHFSSITAASPWGLQCYYAYDGGKTVFVDAQLTDISLPYYGFDHYFMTDNTMSLRFREDNTTDSSCSRSFMYTEPPTEDNVYTVPSYHVTESIFYKFYPLFEENYYTNYVTAEGASPTGTTASQIHSITVDGRQFYARYVSTDNPGDNYPQGEAFVYVWCQVSGSTGLLIQDRLQNFGDEPEADLEEIAARLAGTIKDIH